MAQLSRVPEPVEWADIVTEVTGDKYAYCTENFVLRAPADTEVIACADLCDKAVFAGLIDRFSLQYPGADRRSVASMWTQYYFARLMIAMAVAALELRRQLPLDLADVRLCVGVEFAAPRAFLLPHMGHETDVLPIGQALHGVLRLHAEPLIEAIAGNAGLGRKLLWTNVAAYLDWMVDEIGRVTEQPAARVLASDYKTDIWANGAKNPTYGLIRRQLDEHGVAYGRRKVCCLRYGLPGVAGCGISCPLPQGQTPA